MVLLVDEVLLKPTSSGIFLPGAHWPDVATHPQGGLLRPPAQSPLPGLPKLAAHSQLVAHAPPGAGFIPEAHGVLHAMTQSHPAVPTDIA